jgi:hypothetical protein
MRFEWSRAMLKLGAVAVMAFGLAWTGSICASPALARPPTVTVSPGYDARLAESRQAWSAWQAAQQRYYYKRVKPAARRVLAPSVSTR